MFTSYYGYVDGWEERNKYYIGRYHTSNYLILDIRTKDFLWRNLNMPVESLEHGKALAEAIEATGAY
jgi:hypothetical protein